MYLLDTDVFSELLRERLSGAANAPITKHISLVEAHTILNSVVTISEMMKGMLNLLQRLEKIGRDEAGFDELLRVYGAWQTFPVAPYTEEAHAFFSGFPPAVRRVGRPDCQIAAIALAGDYTVVTRNVRHFAQIPGVIYEDWTRTDAGSLK